jgi:hypothetical protein
LNFITPTPLKKTQQIQKFLSKKQSLKINMTKISNIDSPFLWDLGRMFAQLMEIVLVPNDVAVVVNVQIPKAYPSGKK